MTQEETAGQGDYKKYRAVYENKYLAIIYRKLCKSTYYCSLVSLPLNREDNFRSLTMCFQPVSTIPKFFLEEKVPLREIIERTGHINFFGLIAYIGDPEVCGTSLKDHL